MNKKGLNIRLWKTALATFFILWPCFFASFASASFNEAINYQGRLADDGGNAVVDGNYNMRFRLCADSSCASVLYDETWINADKVPVVGGLFSVMLGSVSSTLATVDFNQDIYLEVSVGGTGVPAWETLLPRKRLGAVPNAFNTQKFDGLATTSFLRSDVTNLIATISNLTSTNFYSENVSSTNSTSTNLFASVLNSLTSIINDLTATWANITNLVFGSATGNSLTVTDLTATSTANIKTLNASSTLAINTTTTNLAIIGASTNSFLATNALGIVIATATPVMAEADPFWLAASTSYFNLAVSNTASGDNVFTGVNTFATTSMSFGSYIGDIATGVAFEKEYFYDASSTSYYPFFAMNFNSAGISDIFGNNIGTMSRGLNILEGNSLTGDNFPALNFVSRDFLSGADYDNYASINYSTSSNSLTFNLVSGDYNFNGGDIYANNNLFVSGTTTASCFSIDGVSCITGGSGSSQWSNNGSNIYFNTGNVGIGSSSPSTKLVVYGTSTLVGGLAVGSSTARADFNYYYSEDSNLSGLKVRNVSTGTSATTEIQLWSDLAQVGFIGVGGSNYNLYDFYQGGMAIGSFDNLYLTSGATGKILFKQGINNDEPVMAVDDGKLGIGTTTPNYTLTVASDSSFLNLHGKNGVNPNIVMSNSSSSNIFVIGSDFEGNQMGFGVLDESANLVSSTFHFYGTTTASCFTVDGITCITGGGASQWSDSGSDIYYTVGNVGIGMVPTSKLSVAGNISVIGDYAYRYNGVNMMYGSSTIHSYFFADAGNTSSTGGWNMGFGQQALLANTTGANNVAIGGKALASNLSGYSNVAIGSSALYRNTSGFNNVAIGLESMYNNLSGSNNIAFGYRALYHGSSTGNTVFGFQAGYGTTTSESMYNQLFGYQSGFKLQTGNNNNLFGYQSGFNLSTGNDNAFIGNKSGFLLTTGSDNILFGNSAGYNLVNGSGNILIGKNAQATSSNSSNFLNIGDALYGNLTTGNIGIGTTTPQTKLTVVGTSTFWGDVSVKSGLLDSAGSYGSYGQVLMSQGNSALWVSTTTLGMLGGDIIGGGSNWVVNESGQLTPSSTVAVLLATTTVMGQFSNFNLLDYDYFDGDSTTTNQYLAGFLGGYTGSLTIASNEFNIVTGLYGVVTSSAPFSELTVGVLGQGEFGVVGSGFIGVSGVGEVGGGFWGSKVGTLSFGSNVGVYGYGVDIGSLSIASTSTPVLDDSFFPAMSDIFSGTGIASVNLSYNLGNLSYGSNVGSYSYGAVGGIFAGGSQSNFNIDNLATIGTDYNGFGMISFGDSVGGYFSGGAFGIAAGTNNDGGTGGLFITSGTSSKALSAFVNGTSSIGLNINTFDPFSLGSINFSGDTSPGKIGVNIDGRFATGLYINNRNASDYAIMATSGLNYFGGNTTFNGNVSVNSGLLDSTGSYGFYGQVLMSSGTSTLWVSTSTLGIVGGELVGGSSQWSDSGGDIYFDTGNVTIGTTSSNAKLQVSGGDVLFDGDNQVIYTINPPTNPVLSLQYNPTQLWGDYHYLADGSTQTYHIYSYRDINGIKVFSADYLEASVVDDNSGRYYYVEISWDEVNEVDGYLVIKPEEPYGRYAEVYTNSAEDHFWMSAMSESSLAPKSPYVIESGIGLFYDSINTRIGIGTTTPIAKLHIEGDGSILAVGKYNGGVEYDNDYGWDGGELGSGTRLMWIPHKAAFRVGSISGLSGDFGGSEWDNLNIGEYSFAGGSDPVASGVASFAFGNGTLASGFYSTSFGYGTIASGDNSFAIGYTTLASGNSSVAMGYDTIASGDDAFAMGYGTIASNDQAVALGDRSLASGLSSFAMGRETVASGYYSTALGYQTLSSGWNSTALGDRTEASGDSSFVSGYRSIASGTNAFAHGYYSFATGGEAIALGAMITVSGDNSIGIGLDRNAGIGDIDITRNNTMAIMGGNLGVGTTTPDSRLTVVGDAYITGTTTASCFTIDGINCLTGSSQWLNNGSNIYYTTGNIGIGTSNPTEALEVNGNVKISGVLSVGSADWAQVGNSFATTTATAITIATLSSTTIAMIDASNDKLKTLTFDGTNWSQVGNDLFISGVGAPALTALNSTDVAFVDITNDSLRTYRFDGTNWAQVGSSTAIASVATGVSLATLSSTTIAFIDAGNDSLRTYTFNGTNWSLVGSGLTISTVGAPALTALNSTDVAFIDITNGSLRTYRFNGTNWSQLGNSLAIPGIATGVSLATLNGYDVALIDVGNKQLTTYRFNGTDWTQFGSPLGVAGIGIPALTGLNNTDVAFIDITLDSLRTYRFTSNVSLVNKDNKLGVGITNPDYMLDIWATGNYDLFNLASTSGSSMFSVKNSGNIGIGVANPTQLLHLSSENSTAIRFETKATQFSPNGFTSSASTSTLAGSSKVWGSINNIINNDVVTASVNGIQNWDYSEYLIANAANFSIPSNAVIKGIEVKVKRYTNSPSSTVKDYSVRIVKDGVIGEVDMSKANYWPSDYEYAVYGSSGDLWGRSWVPEDLNSGKLGFAIAVTGNSNHNASIDYIYFVVHYSLDAYDYTVGIDKTDFQSFKISRASDFGSYDYLTVTTAGDLGLGTTTPQARLHVSGSIGTNDLFVISSSSNESLLTVSSAGNLGLGISAPTEKLSVVGNGLFQLTATSSLTISNINLGGLVDIPLLTGYAYTENVASENLNILGIADRLALMEKDGLSPLSLAFYNGNLNSIAEILVTTSTKNVLFGKANNWSFQNYDTSAITLGIDVENDAVFLNSLDTNGAVYSNNGILTNVAPSSRDYKNSIAPIDLNLDALLGLQVKSFIWNNNNQADFGLIAEEIRDTLPELYADNGKTKGYRADHLPFYLLQIAQRQNQEIKVLGEQVSQLNAEALKVLSEPTDINNFTTLSVASSADFYGTIMVRGEAGFESKVIFKDHVYFSQDTAGTAKIMAGATSTEVRFAKPYESVPIISITPKKKMTGITWWVENETADGFTIAVDPLAGQDLEFNWIAIATIAGEPVPAVESSDSDTDIDTEEPIPAPETSDSEDSSSSEASPASPLDMPAPTSTEPQNATGTISQQNTDDSAGLPEGQSQEPEQAPASPSVAPPEGSEVIAEAPLE